MSASTRRRHLRPVLALVAASLVASVTALAPGSSAAEPQPRSASAARVHWADGAPLTGRSTDAPGHVVREFLEDRGAGAQTVTGLRRTGSWTAGGVRQLRFEQYVGGLRVAGAYAKAALDPSGRLLSLIEDTVDAGIPTAAPVDEDTALRAAVRSLFPERRVSVAGSSRAGATTTYPAQGFTAPPAVERVVVPTTAGGLAEGFEVTTWTEDNQLNVTLVSGTGDVVGTELRTAQDSYHVFPEDPASTPQTTVIGGNWISGSQSTRNLVGNNAHAYLDTDADNAPDAGGTLVTNGAFTATFDPSAPPGTGTNPDVSVQNLFHLTNVIHDTLLTAGFTEAAGNFQEDNFGGGGLGGDPVRAEAQDGSGTDNANFATPTDGTAPRMQMFLWHAPLTHRVVLDGTTTSYGAAGASWGAQLAASGFQGTTVRPSVPDACATLTRVPAGSFVVAERGGCEFTTKALNAQKAGAAALVVVNNTDGNPFTMGGRDRRVTVPGVMVSRADGAWLGSGLAVTLQVVSPEPVMRDGDLDSDIVWHEYGHGLTWRMIGSMSGPLAGAVGEGMSDVLAVVVNDDPVVGEYSLSDPAGIRRQSYEEYDVMTYGDVTGAEVHEDGEVYGAIGWALWKEYQAAGLGRAAILADLVNGMNFTPAGPGFEQMRDGILKGLALTSPDRSCMVWRSFARFGVGEGAVGRVKGRSASVTESFSYPQECARTTP
jgi:hypothetical protein